jgi:hypothetical protein
LRDCRSVLKMPKMSQCPTPPTVHLTLKKPTFRVFPLNMGGKPFSVRCGAPVADYHQFIIGMRGGVIECNPFSFSHCFPSVR